jgi:hypothetical protein
MDASKLIFMPMRPAVKDFRIDQPFQRRKLELDLLRTHSWNIVSMVFFLLFKDMVHFRHLA